MNEQANMAIRYEREIPEGYEARIEGNKVIIELIEPKETEDERVRKDLITFICQFAPEHLKTEYVAYLERQKEQQPAEGTALQKAFINSKSYTLEEKCDASDYAEAILPTSVTYGENEEEYKLHKIIEAAFIAGQKKEQKPAEKQDYSDLNDFERAIHRGFLSAGVENVPVAIIKETAQECLAQMKPAEWSEEDEQWLESIIKDYEDSLIKDKDHAAIIEIKIDFLKSLRHQPHWKPSEKQLIELKHVISGCSFEVKDIIELEK